MERSLVIVKPDAVQRGLIGEILQRFEKKGLKIVALKMMRLEEAILRDHYAHHTEKPFFPELSSFMRSSPVAVFVIEGYQAIEFVRRVCGTHPHDLGTIRGDYCISAQRNIVHSSDSLQAAEQEIKRFFKDGEIFEYDKDEWKHALSSVENPSK